MSTFVVSARKYRPLTFDSVVGQQHVTNTLKNALRNDHLAHAFLFCGPRGVGKTTTARILAKVLNCQNPTENLDPCDTCASCVAFSENASVTVHELDAASNNSVEHIRSLTDQVRIPPPTNARYKIYIIDEVHMLSQAAFNAFLKTLEEPPPYAVFILATTEKHKIIPTILSRCQIFDFNRIQVADMVSHLENICSQEGVSADADALNIIGQKADGALRDALSIYDRIVSFSGKEIKYEDVIENLNILDYDYYFKIVDALLAEDLSAILMIFDEITRKGFEGDLFLNGLAEHFRNLLICQDTVTLQLLTVAGNLKSKYQAQAQLAPKSLLLTALNICNNCDVNYKTARNKRLHVELALIKMTHIQQAVKLSKQQSVEKKTPDVSDKISESTENQQNTKKPIAVDLPEDEMPEVDIKPKISFKEKLQKKKSGGSGLLSMIEEEVLNDEKIDTSAPTIEFNQENLNKLWTTYSEKIESQATRNDLKNSKYSVSGENIEVIVGSGLQRDSVRQEKKLMELLRDQFGLPQLQVNITIDRSETPKAEIKARPKLLTGKEKYQMLKESNPHIDDLQKRFDLRLDQ